jgi:hypothetical protein
MPFLASAILISSPLAPLSLQETPVASSSFIFTRVLPEGNFVAHTAEDGETLKLIAEAYYGNSDYWTTIWNDNAVISDPDNLTEGFLIRLRVPKPEEPVELNDDLKRKLLELGPRPVFAAIRATIVVAPSGYPQSNYEEVYKAAGEKFGVPWQILYGIHYTETGLRNGEIYNYQGSGAQGPMQFMPGTFRAYAVSAHGGAPDINNAEDAIYSAANFLARHGSLQAGLQSYGGNTAGTLAAARSKGFIE